MFGVYIALFTGTTKLPMQTFILEAGKTKNFKEAIQWPSKDMKSWPEVKFSDAMYLSL